MVVVAVYDVVVAVDCMSCSCFSLVVYRVVVVVVVVVFLVLVVEVRIHVQSCVIACVVACVVAHVVTFVARNQVEALVVAFVVAFAVRIQHLAPTSVASPFVEMTSLHCVLVWQHFANGVNGVMLNSLVILSVALV